MDTALPPRTHNNPPPYDPAVLDALRPPVTAFAETAGQWLDLGEIKTEEDAARLNDFLAGARKLSKQIDEARVAQKKPHDDAAKAVQSAFSPMADVVAKSADKVKPMMTRWLQRQKEAAEAERRAAAEEAARIRREAEEQARLASMRNDVVAEAEAEAKAKEAEKAAKAAEKEVKVNVGSATGGARTTGLRTYRKAVIEKFTLACMTLKDEPELIATLERLATARIRAAGWPKDGDLPGFNIIEEQKV